MARKKKRSLDERLSRFSAAQDVSRALSSGIDRLPVSELARTILKVKSTEAVVVVAETGAAVARGAGAAAREGLDTYHRSKVDLTRVSPEDGEGRWDAGDGRPPIVVTVTPPTSTSTAATSTGPGAPGTTGTAGGEELTQRLERLSRLHAAGHLDDREYAAAKAAVLGL